MSNELERLARRGRLPYTYEVRQVASPVAGADFTITPRPGEVWRLVAVKASLHASAVAGNRFPQLVIDNATDISEKYVAGVATIANGTTLYSWISGFPVVLAAAEAGLVTVPITERIIQTGWTIHPVTAALDAGDLRYLCRIGPAG